MQTEGQEEEEEAWKSSAVVISSKIEHAMWEIILKRRSKIFRNPSKDNPKWYQILGKSTSGAVLEHFGRPLGAKMAQERHQEQTLMKNTQF